MRKLSAGFVICVTLSSCASAPTEQQASSAFEARIRKDAGNSPFSVSYFSKTNGQALEMGGIKGYRLFYSATVTFPQGNRPECVPQGNRFMGFDCGMMAGRGLQPVPIGGSVSFEGQVIFQQTERG